MMPELNKIYTGDCLEIMRGWPDKCVDHVITDPPYEMEAHTLQRRVKRGNVLAVPPLGFKPMNPTLRKEFGSQVQRICRSWCLIFCQIEALHLWIEAVGNGYMNYRRACIWVKPDGMPQYSGDRPGMGYETIATFHRAGKSEWNGGGQHGVFTQNKNENGGIPNQHPTQKPLRLMQQLLSLFTCYGDIVCDPFCGSGSTLVAALQKETPFVGIEINPDYVKIAEARIAAERAQLKLPL